MSIFTTRKSLAFAAIAALGSSLFAGLPAHAASLTLAPTAGTSYALPAGDTLVLRETASSEVASSNFALLKVKVVNIDGVAAAVTLGAGSPVDVSGVAGHETVIPYTGTTNNALISVDSQSSTVSSHFAITAFLDINANGAFDPTTTDIGSTQTVTFLKASDLTVSTAFASSVFKNATSASATTSFTNVNNDQLIANGHTVSLAFSSGIGTDFGTQTASFNSSSKLFEATTTGFPAVAAGSIVRVQAKLDGTNVGSSVGTTVLTTAINSLTASTVVGTAANSSNQVAVNGSYQVQVVAKDDATTPAPVAGRAVTYSVSTSATLSSTVTLTINGQTYTSNAALPGASSVAKLSGTTDSAGKVTVSVASAGLVAGQQVTFNFFGDTVSTTTSLTTTQAAAVYTGYVTNFDNGFTAVTPGTAVDVAVAVYDQFGNIAPNVFDARAQLTSSSGRTTQATTATNSIVALSSGKATLHITDNGTGTGSNVYKINFIQRDPVYGGYGSYVENVIANFEVRLVNAADTVPGVVSLGTGTKGTDGKYSLLAGSTGSSSAPQSIGGFDFANYDSRSVLGSAPATDGYYVTVSGNVSSATTTSYNGVAVGGAKVTLSATGLQFRVVSGSATVYSVDSAAVTTDSLGNFTARVWSHKSGAQTVTVTAGSVSSQIDVYFGAAGAEAGSKIVIDAPVYSLPGKSIVLSALLTDKFGNPVLVPDSAVAGNPDFKLTVTGIGNIGNAALATNIEGKASVVATLGANDLGTLTVTAVYDADGTGPLAAVTATKQVQIAFGAPVPSDAKITITAPATSQSGRSLDVSVLVTDKDGKALPDAYVTLSSLGAGYIATPNVITDSNGKAQFKLIVGTGENGLATISATAGTVKASTSTTFGITDANINKAAKRVTVDWAFAAGKRVVITRNGVQIKNLVPTTDDAGNFSFSLKKGTWKIVIKVGGVTIDSQTYKVKK